MYGISFAGELGILIFRCSIYLDMLLSAVDSCNYRLLKRGYISNVAVLRSQDNPLYALHTRNVMRYFIPLVLYPRTHKC